jgi:hypothetical protein
MSTEFQQIFQRLLRIYRVRTKSALAKALGITPQAIWSAEHRHEIPQPWIRRAAMDTDARPEWLETGEEPIYRLGQPTLQSLPPAARELLARWEHLSPSQQALLQQCASLLPAAEADIRHDLAQIAQLVEARPWPVLSPTFVTMAESTGPPPADPPAPQARRPARRKEKT